MKEPMDVWMQDEVAWEGYSDTILRSDGNAEISMTLSTGRKIIVVASREPGEMCMEPVPARANQITDYTRYRCALPPDHDCPHMAMSGTEHWRAVAYSTRQSHQPQTA